MKKYINKCLLNEANLILLVITKYQAGILWKNRVFGYFLEEDLQTPPPQKEPMVRFFLAYVTDKFKIKKNVDGGGLGSTPRTSHQGCTPHAFGC